MVISDLQGTRLFGNLVPRSPHIRKPGDPASVSCLLCLTHIGNSQGSFIGDCHGYEETQVGQEIGRDAQHPPKAMHHVLTLGPLPFPTPEGPKKTFRWQAPPILFPIIPSSSSAPSPLSFLHILQLSRTSLNSFLHQPYSHLFLEPPGCLPPRPHI